jgi:acylphosphatase
MTSYRRKRRIVARATGKVQGVGYRAFCTHEATQMLIAGYARNLDDGRTVEVVAEADEPTLRAFVERLREGPELARVDGVTFRWEEPSEDFAGFEVVI